MIPSSGNATAPVQGAYPPEPLLPVLRLLTSGTPALTTHEARLQRRNTRATYRQLTFLSTTIHSTPLNSSSVLAKRAETFSVYTHTSLFFFISKAAQRL